MSDEKKNHTGPKCLTIPLLKKKKRKKKKVSYYSFNCVQSPFPHPGQTSTTRKNHLRMIPN